LQDGGVLNWGLSSTIANFNYFNVNGGQTDTYSVVGALLPRPFHYTASGETSVDTDYFTSIEVTSTDPLTITYSSNPDAVWSDGSPVGVADLAGMWKANNGSDPAYEGFGTTGYDQIVSVEEGATALDTVVTFGTNFADWQRLFDPLLPSSLTATADAFNNSWASAPLVTAAAFVWGGEDKTAQTYTLERNPDWWGDPAKLDSIVFRAYAEPAAAIQAFKTDQVDFLALLADADQYAAANAIDGVDVRTAGSAVFRRFTFNTEDPVMSDPAVRQAVILGIDRVTMSNVLVGKIGGTPGADQNHIFVPTQAAYQENCAQLCDYDPDAAKVLLEGAGWEMGDDGYFAKDGETLELAITVQSGRANSANEAQLAQSTLKEAGIKLEINTVPVLDFFTNYITPGNFQLATWTWTGSALPVAQSLSMYTLDKDNVLQNYGRGGSEEINDLLYEAVSSTDVDTENALANEADAALWQEAAFLPLYQVPENVAVRSTVANLGSPGFADIRYQDIGYTE
jgi:peptide/nickel transport system substrate-binding protein